MGNMVEVGNERLASVERDIKHLSNGHDRLERSQERLERSQESMSEAVVKLTVIAQQGVDFNREFHDRTLPRIDELEKGVSLVKNEQASSSEIKNKVEKMQSWMHKKDGAILAIITVFTLFREQIIKALGL